jgi:hypothetical protein
MGAKPGQLAEGTWNISGFQLRSEYFSNDEISI